MNTESLQNNQRQNNQMVTILSTENVNENTAASDGQIGEVIGLPIMLLIITYLFKILIHNHAKWSDLGKAIIEFPIDFMSIAISVYVTYRYLSVTGNVFTTEIMYFIVAVIFCCFCRKIILNSCSADEIKKRHFCYIVIAFAIEVTILIIAFYYLLSLFQCTQI